jgi:hypothetical protein
MYRPKLTINDDGSTLRKSEWLYATNLPENISPRHLQDHITYSLIKEAMEAWSECNKAGIKCAMIFTETTTTRAPAERIKGLNLVWIEGSECRLVFRNAHDRMTALFLI